MLVECCYPDMSPCMVSGDSVSVPNPYPHEGTF